MDKSCQSSADSTTTTSSATASSSNGIITTNNLRQLNKLSHKISKPIIRKPTFDSSQNDHCLDHNQPNPPPPVHPQAQQQQHQHQHQPPVYNINKNDFRDVVQKLTGSPAHERISTPPPIQQPKPPSSRLQRIRPPPLAQISNRPPPLLNTAIPRPQPPNFNDASAISSNAASVSNFSGFGRPLAPLSPLPPFPTVHAAAESPVSAYMRYLQNSMSNIDSNSKQFSGFSPLAPLVSPRWNNFAPQQPQPEPQSQVSTMQQGVIPSQTSAMTQSQPLFQLPPSPAPFGCLNSPRSPYPLLSPSLLFSPSSGQLGFPQLPLSPTVPVPSPRWRGGENQQDHRKMLVDMLSGFWNSTLSYNYKDCIGLPSSNIVGESDRQYCSLLTRSVALVGMAVTPILWKSHAPLPSQQLDYLIIIFLGLQIT
ncbi:VQ motif-containing protein 9 [Senna tora]|uniref:VQ motif-containing protein 9 n=1 Tax=Senna tora TaxID=362788 RepID=A0A834T816_9FABA|nr:VQ motif-containing protein 9 [Senna tora]